MKLATRTTGRAAFLLATAAALALLAVPAAFGGRSGSSGMVAANLGSQNPRDTAMAEWAGVVPSRLG
jgi:hypothetical protein